MTSSTNMPAPLADTVSMAGFEHVDPMRRAFAGASNSPALQNVGVVDSGAWAIMGHNTGGTGGACWFQSGNTTYTLTLDNNGINAYGGFTLQTGTLNVLSGGLGITGTTTFSSPVVMQSTLAVTGTATFSGSPLNVTGTATFSGPVNINSPLHVTSTSQFVGAMVLSGNLTVTGSGAFSAGLTVSSGGALVSAGGLTVSAGGMAISSGGLTATGTSTLTGNVFVTDRLTVQGDFAHTGNQVGFFNSAVNSKQTITGAKGGNAALGSLLSALANYGFVTDSTSA